MAPHVPSLPPDSEPSSPPQSAQPTAQPPAAEVAPLDIEQPALLRQYLSTVADGGETGRPALPGVIVDCTLLTGGVSNRVVRVTFANGSAWVLKQALPKLRVAQDWFCDPARIDREALGLQWLARILPPGSVPQCLFHDAARHVLAMEAVPPPHANWKAELLAGRIDADLVARFGTLLGTLHRTSAATADPLAALFADRRFFEDLRLAPYYDSAARAVPAAAPFLRALIDETRAHADRESGALVHGDYSPKNVLIHAGRPVLLDHEVMHWGDPAFDVGFSLTHFLAKARHLPAHRSGFLQAARTHWEAYQDAAGPAFRTPAVAARAVRHTLACLLARVDGRSPLEYLSADARTSLRASILRLLPSPPPSPRELIQALPASW